jgi:phosphopantetheine adenylyltransferase
MGSADGVMEGRDRVRRVVCPGSFDPVTNGRLAIISRYCQDNGISAIVKGLRAVSDFEYEMEMAQMNYRLAEIETLFIAANPVYSFLRSSLVKEICRYGGDVRSLVPELVFERLQERLGSARPQGPAAGR